MMEYKDGEVIVATPCEHVFHKRCCQEWFQLARTCPVCRFDVPNGLTTQSENMRDPGVIELAVASSNHSNDQINRQLDV